MGRKAMGGLSKIMHDKLTDVKLKVRLVKAMLFPVVMYGSERWVLRKPEEKKLEASEMWCWRRVLRLSWTKRVPNEAMIKRVQPKPRYLDFGQVIRSEGLEKWWCWDAWKERGGEDGREHGGWMES